MTAVVLFDREGNWQDTLVCAQRMRDALHDVGAVHGGAAERGTAADLRVLQPTGAAGVFYLPHEGGWLGVLCEAGEWIAVPPALVYLDAGETPPVTHRLPSQDDFIDRLLALFGDEPQDDAG